MNSAESLRFAFETYKRHITTFLWESNQARFFGAGHRRVDLQRYYNHLYMCLHRIFCYIFWVAVPGL